MDMLPGYKWSSKGHPKSKLGWWEYDNSAFAMRAGVLNAHIHYGVRANNPNGEPAWHWWVYPRPEDINITAAEDNLFQGSEIDIEDADRRVVEVLWDQKRKLDRILAGEVRNEWDDDDSDGGDDDDPPTNPSEPNSVLGKVKTT